MCAPRLLLPIAFVSLLPLRAAAEESAIQATPETREEIRLEGQSWSLAQVARYAIANAPAVNSAKARWRQERAGEGELRSRLLPHLEGGASYTRLSNIRNAPLFAPAGDPAEARMLAENVQDPAARELLLQQLTLQESLATRRIPVPRDQYALYARLSYPITQIFIEILPSLRAQRAGAEARRYELEAARQSTALQALEIFLQHLRARAFTLLAQSEKRRWEENRRFAQARLASGRGSEPDVARFDARLAASERALSEAQAESLGSYRALALLLRRSLPEALTLDEDLRRAPPRRLEGSQETLSALALRQRPEVRALQRLVASQRAAAQASGAPRIPTLSAVAVADYANPNRLYIPPQERFQSSWSAGLQLRWSPDEALAASYAKQRAGARVQEIEEQAHLLEENIRIEIARFHALYQSAFVGLEESQREAEAAELAYRARRKSYELGLSQSLELIEAQSDLERAYAAWIQAGVDLRLREARLRKALGQPLWR